MAMLKIWGWGTWLSVTQLDESIAKKYADSQLISESENDNLDMESDGISYGFDRSADVYVDDIHLGTVDEVLEKSKDSEKYQEIMKDISFSEINTIKNAWVKEESYKGVFAEVEIDKDCLDENGVTKKFYEDFIENIELVDANQFYLPQWNENPVEEDGVDCKSAEFFIMYNNKSYSLEIVEDDEFEED